MKVFATLAVAALASATAASLVSAQGDARRPLVGAGTERRLALVIGNNAYKAAPLVNAVPDAMAVATALREASFDVTTVTDADLPAFERAVESFVARLQPTDISLFYYSGHGIQIDGVNYLLPIEFRANDAADAKAQSYSAARLQEKLETRARLRVIVLDACRDNPFKRSRSASGGLAAMQGRGSLIAFATAEGSTASDNPKGKNGLFTEHLLEVIRQPGLTSREVFFKVRERVDAASGGKQFPWVSDGLIGDFVFKAGTAASGTPAPTPAAPPAPVVRTSRLPRPATGAVIERTLAGSTGSAYHASISPGSTWVAAGYDDGVVKLWDPRSGKEVASLGGQIGAVKKVAFSPDGLHLAASSGDMTVHIWNLEQQVIETRLVGHAGAIRAIAYSPDGRALATAAADGTVRLWNSATGEPRGVLTAHGDDATCVVFTRDGRSLVSGGLDRHVRVWDVERLRQRLAQETPSGVQSVAVTRKGDRIAAGLEDGGIIVSDAEGLSQQWKAAAHKGPVWALSFSADGAWLASGGADSAVEVWNAELGKLTQTYRGHSQWAVGVTFDSSNSWLVSAGGEGDLRIWRMKK